MVDSETIEAEVSDKKEEFEEENKENEETEDPFEKRKEKTKTIADNLISEINKSIDEFKENIKNMQKAADKKYSDYKKSTVQSLDVDLIETDDVYYIKVAVPGVEKDEVIIEASDNDITIEATLTPYIEEFADDESAEIIVSSLKSGRCVKTVRFENSINIEEISAKFQNGLVYISVPKLIIPKHKVNVE